MKRPPAVEAMRGLLFDAGAQGVEWKRCSKRVETFLSDPTIPASEEIHDEFHSSWYEGFKLNCRVQAAEERYTAA